MEAGMSTTGVGHRMNKQMAGGGWTLGGKWDIGWRFHPNEVTMEPWKPDRGLSLDGTGMRKPLQGEQE